MGKLYFNFKYTVSYLSTVCDCMILSLFFLLISSCNKLDDEHIQSGNGQEQEQGGADEDGMLKIQILDKDYNISWKEEEIMGVFVTDTLLPGSKGQDNYENIKATYERESWNLSEKIILPEDNKDIYAYLPYKEGMMLDSMDIETGMSTVPLWGKAKHCVNKEDPIALIDLNTPMTFVKVRIRKVNFPGEKILQSVRIYNETEGLPVKGKMNMLSGKVKAFEFNELISENIQAKINDIYTDAASASFLTLPSSGERGETMIEIIIDGKIYTAKLNANAARWESGMVNEIAVTFNGKILSVENVSIKEWIKNSIHIGVEW
jgi:hypothetical protein